MSTHSFGGSALDRHVFDFEAYPDADPGVALEPGFDPAEDPYAFAGGGEFIDPGLYEPAPTLEEQYNAALAEQGVEYQRQLAELVAGVDAELQGYRDRFSAMDHEAGLAQLEETLTGHEIPAEHHDTVRDTAAGLAVAALVEHCAAEAGLTTDQAIEFFDRNPLALQAEWDARVTDDVARAALEQAAAGYRWANGGQVEHYRNGGRVVDAMLGKTGPLAGSPHLDQLRHRFEERHDTQLAPAHDWRSSPNLSVSEMLRRRNGA